MATKRASPSQDETTDERDLQVSGKRRNGPSELQDTRYLQFLAGASSNSTNDMEVFLERIVRKAAQEVIPPILEEVIPRILQRYPSPCRGLSLNGQIGTPGGGRSLQLCFMNSLRPIGFTQLNIRAEDGSPLQIALCDATIQHRKVIKEDGPSMKVEICVLKGDFGSEDWTAEEFNANIVSQREGKPPLLNGNTVITLKRGVCFVENVEFTDNSSWTRSGKFRIGVKVWKSTSIGADIKEGRSEPIRVKDKRGEADKADRPSLNDKVWRLHKIGKKGPIRKQLSLNGIKTVQDLLRLYTTNQASLQQKIGNIPRKAWEKIIRHAKTCEIDDEERYTYQYSTAEQSIYLVFNCIYQVVEVSFDGQNFSSVESLNSEEERLVERAKRNAYKNLKDLKPIEPTPHSLVGTLSAVQFGLPLAQQGQPQTWPNFCQSSTSTTPNIDGAAHNDQVGYNQLPDQLVEMPPNWSSGEQLISGAYTGDNGWPNSGSHINQFANYFVAPTPWEPEAPFYFPCDYDASSSTPFPNSDVYISSKGERKTVWSKIRNAFKWAILYSAKRKAKVFHYQY